MTPCPSRRIERRQTLPVSRWGSVDSHGRVVFEFQRMSNDLSEKEAPYVVQIGLGHAEIRGWHERLERLATVDCFPSLAAALAVPTLRTPRVTLLVQRHPDVWDDRQLIAWRRRFPLTRCLLLRGPWVAGRLAIDSSSDGLRSFRWDDSRELLQAAVMALQHGREPRTTSSKPRRYDPQSGTTAPDGPSRRGAAISVCVRSGSPDVIDAVESVLIPAGLLCGAMAPSSDATRGGTIGIFDEADNRDWTHDPAWSVCQGRIALVRFLRPHERGPLQQMGYDDVMAYPQEVDRLLVSILALADAIQGGPAPAPGPHSER